LKFGASRILGQMLVCVLVLAGSANGQSVNAESGADPAPAVSASDSAQPTATVLCESTNNQRRRCNANTAAGVALMRSTRSGVCLLGKTWGYDDTGVWVSGNCGAEFALGQVGPASQAETPAAGAQPAPKPVDRIETWGEFDPGRRHYRDNIVVTAVPAPRAGAASTLEPRHTDGTARNP